MASMSMAMPITCSSHKGLTKPSSQAFFNPLPLNPSRNKAMFVIPRANKVIKVEVSFKEKVISGLTAGALTAAMLVPDVAQAASGVSPSLQNFLFSIVSGGVVLVGIVGAVVGFSSFDPVKRT